MCGVLDHVLFSQAPTGSSATEILCELNRPVGMEGVVMLIAIAHATLV